MHALLFSEVRDVAELVVLAAGFGKAATVVEHARLAELERDLGLEVRRDVRDQRRAVEVGVGRRRVLLLEEEPDDADIDAQLVFVRSMCVHPRSVGVQRAGPKRTCLLPDSRGIPIRTRAASGNSSSASSKSA